MVTKTPNALPKQKRPCFWAAANLQAPNLAVIMLTKSKFVSPDVTP